MFHLVTECNTPRDLAWVFQRDFGCLCVHYPSHAPLGECAARAVRRRLGREDWKDP
jgi:hypothetical protein